MQDDSGVRQLLSRGWIYAAVQSLAGANRARTWLAEHVWRCGPETRVVDIGCGTGEVLDFLPRTVHYVGIDLSAAYIARAQAHYGNRATFLVGTATQLLDQPHPQLRDTDLVLCNGLLHHLDDAEVNEVFALAKQLLRAGGRLVCLEPTWLVHQLWSSRWLMAQDRGKNIRTEAEWKALASGSFRRVESSILTGLYRIPYTHIVLECHANDTASVTAAHAATLATESLV